MGSVTTGTIVKIKAAIGGSVAAGIILLPITIIISAIIAIFCIGKRLKKLEDLQIKEKKEEPKNKANESKK